MYTSTGILSLKFDMVGLSWGVWSADLARGRTGPAARKPRLAAAGEDPVTVTVTVERRGRRRPAHSPLLERSGMLGD